MWRHCQGSWGIGQDWRLVWLEIFWTFGGAIIISMTSWKIVGEVFTPDGSDSQILKSFKLQDGEWLESERRWSRFAKCRKPTRFWSKISFVEVAFSQSCFEAWWGIGFKEFLIVVVCDYLMDTLSWTNFIYRFIP